MNHVAAYGVNRSKELKFPVTVTVARRRWIMALFTTQTQVTEAALRPSYLKAMEEFIWLLSLAQSCVTTVPAVNFKAYATITKHLNFAHALQHSQSCLSLNSGSRNERLLHRSVAPHTVKSCKWQILLFMR